MPAKGRQPVSAVELQHLAAELRARALTVKRLSDKLEREKGRTIEVAGMPMVRRGLLSVQKFVLACKLELGET